MFKIYHSAIYLLLHHQNNMGNVAYRLQPSAPCVRTDVQDWTIYHDHVYNHFYLLLYLNVRYHGATIILYKEDWKQEVSDAADHARVKSLLSDTNKWAVWRQLMMNSYGDSICGKLFFLTFLMTLKNSYLKNLVLVHCSDLRILYKFTNSLMMLRIMFITSSTDKIFSVAQ